MAVESTSAFLALGAVGIIIILIVFAISVLYNSAIVLVVSKLFKLKNTKFKTALITALAAGVANFIATFVLQAALGGSAATTGSSTLTLNVVAIAANYVINSLAAMRFYKLTAGKSFLVGLAWTVISYIVALIVGLVIGLVILAILVASGVTAG